MTNQDQRSMRFHLVHVGKCAGESVIDALRPKLPTLQIYHVGASNEAIANLVLRRQAEDIFIVLSRDPAKRFVSAFEWDLHSKSVNGSGRKMPNEIWSRVYDTFETANDLAEALTSPQAHRRETAHFALTASKLHMQYDLGWYIRPEIAAEMPAGRTYLIRLETLERDLRTFLESHKLPFQGIRATKNNYKHLLPAERLTRELSAQARRNIVLASHATAATLGVFDSRLASPEACVLE